MYIRGVVRYLFRIMIYVVEVCYDCYVCCFFFKAEDGIRDLVRSRGLGDVYKRQAVGALGAVYASRGPRVRS